MQIAHFKGGAVDFSSERELVGGDDSPFPPKVAKPGQIGMLLYNFARDIHHSYLHSVKRLHDSFCSLLGCSVFFTGIAIISLFD